MEIPSPIGPGPFWLGGGITPPYLYQMRAFIWDEEHGMQDLKTLPGGSDAQAILINEPGQVVGYSYTASTHTGACFPLATDSFIWEKGKGMTDLGGFGGTCTLATALNNRGQVVGESYRTGDQSAPGFLWEKGSIQELEGSFGGDFSGAFAINEQGEAAGFATLPRNATFHAALWTSVKSIADLGVIGSDLCSYAAAINEHAQVVGSSLATCDSDTGPVRAILWEGGSLFDLNALIPADSSLHLQFTQAINDRGEIAGSGADSNGNQHAFLLIPCDDSHPNIEGCDYSPLDAAAVEMSTRSDSLRESASTPNSNAPRGELAPEVQSALGSERNPLNRLFRRRLAFARTLATPRVATLTSTALTSGPNATLSPMNLIFSTRAIGTTSSGQKITLSNMGTTTLNITSIAITGTNAGDFSQTHTCGSSLASTASCTISVTFRPSASGTRTAAVSVTDNASGSPQKVALTGTGTTAKLSPGNLSFSTQPIGTTSAGKSVTLTNVGTTSFNITAIAITGTDAGDYSQTHTCGSSLAASASCTITVTFKPTASGTRTATLSVTDSAVGSPQTVPLTGGGTAAKLSPTSLNFGTIVVGTASAVKTVSLTNVGTTTFNITAIAITGSDPGDFSQTYTCGTSLAPTASCTIIVTFKPTTTGTRTAAISVSDTAVGSPQTVSLSGTGTDVELSPTSLIFACIPEPIGHCTCFVSKTTTLTNVGSTTLNISGITISGPFSQTNTCGASVAAGSSCNINVTWSRSTGGGAVSISDNGGASPQTVSLFGNKLCSPH